MGHTNTKSVVLKRFQQLLELEYTGTTPKLYVGYVSEFIDKAKNVPDRINNKDVLDYNIHIRHWQEFRRNGAISAIKAYFRLYLRKECRDFATIRPKKQKRLPKVYDYESIKTKIENLPNVKHRCILHLGLECWLRVGEVCNLKLSDIDGQRKTVFINRSKGAKDGEIPINEETLNLLRQYFREYRPKEYLFEGQNGGRYTEGSCNKISKRHLGIRFHALRATGANHAHQIGKCIYAISEKLRHSKIETTKAYVRPNIMDLVGL